MIHPYQRGVLSSGVSESLLEGVSSVVVGGTSDAPYLALFRADRKTVRIYLRPHRSGVWTMDIDDPDITPQNIGHVDYVGLSDPRVS